MHIETFSEDCAGGGGFILRMDARAKLVFSLACITVVISLPGLAVPLFTGGLCLAMLLASGAPLKALALRMSGPVLFAAFIAVFQAFLTPGQPMFASNLPGHTLMLSVSGFQDGLHIIARVFGAVMAVLFLTMTTPAHRLLSAAGRLKLPRGFVELSLLTYRYVFVLIEDAATVYQAQKGRLGYAGFGRSVRSLGTLAGSVLLRAYGQAEATGVAMSVRGYTGEYIPEYGERLRAVDAFFLCGSFALCIAVCLWTS